MNVLFAFRLRPLPGFKSSLAAAMLWCVLGVPGWSQFSFNNSAPPVVVVLAADSWPVVGWGMRPTATEVDAQVWSIDQGPGAEAGPLVISLQSTRADIVMDVATNEDLGLGPVVSFAPPALADGETVAPTGAVVPSEAATTELENASFHKVAASFSAPKTRASKDNDMLGKFESTVATAKVADSSSTPWWAVLSLAVVAVIAALVIGYREDERKRRRGSRRRRHRGAS